MQGPLSAADIFVLSRDLPHNGKSRHPISGACFCVEYLILLALIGSVEERHDLCTGAVRIRAERRGRSTVRHVVRYRPVDGVSVERVRGNIREARAALDLLAEGAVQERYALAAGASRVRDKRRRDHAVRDAVLDCPGNRLGIVSVRGNIREAAHRLRLGAAGSVP